MSSDTVFFHRRRFRCSVRRAWGCLGALTLLDHSFPGIEGLLASREYSISMIRWYSPFLLRGPLSLAYFLRNPRSFATCALRPSKVFLIQRHTRELKKAMSQATPA